MGRNYAETSGEVSDFDHLDLGALEMRALRVVVRLADASEPLTTDELVVDGESRRQTQSALTRASKTGLIAKSGRAHWRATGPGRAVALRARRPRKGER